jgi:hypothetical protein
LHEIEQVTPQGEQIMKAVILAAGALLTIAAGPAFATAAIPVPEPTTLSILATAAAGFVIAYRLRRRK